LRVLSTRFLLHSRYLLAGSSHLQIVINLSYSVQRLFFRLPHQFDVSFNVQYVQCWVLPANIPWWARAYCLTIISLRRVSPAAVESLQQIQSHTWECLVSTDTIWYDRNILYCTFRRSEHYLCVSSWSRQQSVISGFQYILYISMELEW
jgi:hypothetical protein